MTSDLVTRYKTVRKLVARSKVAGPFKVGDPVRVLPSHGFAHYRGDTGVIDKMIPINKAYVESEKNGRIIVDLDDLERVKTASAKPPPNQEIEEWWDSISPGQQKAIGREVHLTTTRLPAWNAKDWEQVIDYYVRIEQGDARGWERPRGI